MPTNIISEIFASDDIFAVPEYQRSYSWEKKQIDEFFNDLLEYMEGPQKTRYLMGQIILHVTKSKDKSESENTDNYQPIEKYIVDGQQRLATITLFMCVLRDRLMAFSENGVSINQFNKQLTSLNNCIGFSPTFKLRMGKSNEDFFMHYVQMNEHTYEANLVNKRIMNARCRFEELLNEQIQEGNGLELIKQLSDVITQKVRLTVVETDDEHLAFVFFERLNTRGKPLVPADLLKNYLFGRLTPQNNDLKTLWGKMIEKLSAIMIDDPSDYIRYYWNSMNPKTTASGLYDSVVNRYEDNPSEMISFFRKMLSFVDKFIFILKQKGEVAEINSVSTRKLGNLAMVNAKTFIPLVIALLNNGATPEDIELVLTEIERYTVRNLVVGENPNKIEKTYTDLAWRYSSGNVTVDEICQTIKKSTPSNEILRPKFKTYRIKNDNEGKMLLKAMHDTLYNNGESMVVPDNKVIHLEHIMPQTKGKWPVDETIRAQYVQYLGNTTLLLWSKNLSIKNKLFDEKKDKAYSKSDIVYTREIVKEKEWTPVQIKKRQNRLYKDFIRVWQE